LDLAWDKKLDSIIALIYQRQPKLEPYYPEVDRRLIYLIFKEQNSFARMEEQTKYANLILFQPSTETTV
jgi:hypothetical protein